MNYLYEDPELTKLALFSPTEAFKLCLELIDSDVHRHRYRAAVVLGTLSSTCGMVDDLPQGEVYNAILYLVKRSLDIEDWESGAQAIVSLSTCLKYIKEADERHSPLNLVKLCKDINRPLIWQRILQHIYHFGYLDTNKVREFLNDHLKKDEALFPEIAKSALKRLDDQSIETH